MAIPSNHHRPHVVIEHFAADAAEEGQHSLRMGFLLAGAGSQLDTLSLHGLSFCGWSFLPNRINSVLLVTLAPPFRRSAA